MVIVSHQCGKTPCFFRGAVKGLVSVPEEISMRRILFLPIAFSLAACATAKPKGQVVRLQKDFETEKAAAKTVPSESPIFRQASSGDGDVPTDKDDSAVFYFSMGQAYSLDNDPQRAIEAYRATLVHDPNSALVHARLAAELVKIGNFAEAKLLCEKAVTLDPKYVDSYLLLAGIQVAAKEFESALATYKTALGNDPNNRDALLYYGVTLAEVGKMQEGVAQLDKLVKLKDTTDSNIDQSVAFYYLAKVHDQANQKDAAIRALHESLKRRPGFAKAALVLADLYEGRKDFRKARHVLEEAFKEGRSADIAERLAESLLARNDYKGAVVYLETLVEEDPTNENMRLRLALVYWQVGWLDKARALLVDLHDRYPISSEIAFYLGELEMERKQSDSAIGYYRKISPDYSKYDQMVGRVVHLYREDKRYGEGESFLLEAIRKRPDLVSFYPLLAALYEDQGRLEDAKLALERGHKAFESDESILYYLGFVYDRMGEKDKGLTTMERLLRVNPNNANALNFVGYTLLEKGVDLKTAATYLERAVALKPGDAFVLDSYGWLLYRQGKYRAAMTQLEKAYALKPQEAVIAEHLADSYVALGMPQKALAIYQKALLASDDGEFKARVEGKIENVQSAMAGIERRPARLDSRVPASR